MKFFMVIASALLAIALAAPAPEAEAEAEAEAKSVNVRLENDFQIWLHVIKVFLNIDDNVVFL